MEWWNGIVDWNGMVEWNDNDGIRLLCIGTHCGIS